MYKRQKRFLCKQKYEITDIVDRVGGEILLPQDSIGLNIWLQ